MEEIRVVLADDHELFRAGIRSLLENIKEVKIIGEAADGYAVIELVEKYNPELAILDISMPGLNGLEALSRISKSSPNTKVILLSMYSNKEYVLQALKSGASGYILKDVAWDELELAIKKVMRGELYLYSKVAHHVIEFLKKDKPGVKTNLTDTDYDQLSPRHYEVLKLIGEGLSTKEIAMKLNLSINTVESHRKELMKRLDIHDIAGLVRHSIKIGLVSLE